MSHRPVDFTLAELTEVMRFLVETPTTHARLIDLARTGVMERYGNVVDRDMMDRITHPPSVNITIHPQMHMTDLLVLLGRKFLEDYNHRLRELEHHPV